MPSTDGKETAERTALRRRAFLSRMGALAALGAVGVSGSELVHGPGILAQAATRARVDPADQDPLALLKRMISLATQNFGNGGKTRPFAEMLKSV
jgi:hypothetical protein